MTLKEQYKKQTGRSPFVFDEKGRIKENFSYTDGYVLWLENQIINKEVIENECNCGQPSCTFGCA